MDLNEATRVIVNGMRNAHNATPDSWRDICEEVWNAIHSIVDEAVHRAVVKMKEA